MPEQNETLPPILPGQPKPAPSPSPSHSDMPGGHPIEIYISYVLRIGVTVAAAIIIAGVLVFLIRGPVATEPTSYHAITGGGGHSVATSWTDIFSGIGHGQGLAIVRLGLLVLILTPMMRVGMTVILFAAERDHAFIVLTIIVFIVLVFGFLGID